MPEVVFTSNLKQHIACDNQQGEGSTVREILDSVFAKHPDLRGYVLDDQNRLRKHMIIFIDDATISDRIHLGDTVETHSKLYVMQALSGG